MANTLKNLTPESSSVYKYLKFMENRKLDDAKRMLSKNFTMIFPGSMNFSNLDELINYGKKRQVSVFKTFESFEEVDKFSSKIIYVRGRLYGVSLEEKEFDNIRYIDKFIISDEKFIRQQVWNDFAKSNLINIKYPLPIKDTPIIEGNNIELSVDLDILDFAFSLEYRQDKLKGLFKEDNFRAILPGRKFLKIRDFTLFLEREKKYTEKNIFDVNLIENNQTKIIYLDGSISGLNLEGKKYQNIRFIERIEFDTYSKKIVSFEVWDDLSEHGF